MAADGIPKDVAGKGIAKQHRLQAGFTVFARGARGKRDAGISGRRILKAFSLADGIVGKNDEAIMGEESSSAVVAGLARGAMAGCDEDCRQLFAGGLAIGKVKQSGNQKAGLALKEHLLDAEAVGLGFAKDFGVERGALRQSAEQRQNLLADSGLASFGLGTGLDGCYA